MHIDDYVEELRKDVKKFHEHWMECRAAVEEGGGDFEAMWPVELGAGEWFYQFMAFMEMEHEDDHGD